MNTIRTSKRDVNYLSLNKDSVTWFAGSEDEKPGEIPYPTELVPPNPEKFDSILKCSGRENTTLTNVKVSCGRENSLDINNETNNCSFWGEWALTGPTPDQIFTIKGGSRNIEVGGTVYGEGKNADIVLGQWADQSYEKTKNIDLSHLRHVTGRPLTVILSHCDWKSIKLPPNAKVLKFKSYCYLAYWWVKYAYVTTIYSWFVKPRGKKS